ncbi:hypothetical protein ABK040_011384 [Willaertia magna]
MDVKSNNFVRVNLFNSNGDEVETSFNSLTYNKAMDLFDKGQNLSEQKKYLEAINCFTKCIFLKPNNVQFYIERAKTYTEIHDYKSAIVNYKKVLAIDPKNKIVKNYLSDIYHMTGLVFYRDGIFSKALTHFTKAFEYNTTNATLLLHRATVWIALKNYKEALRDLLICEQSCEPYVYVIRCQIYLCTPLFDLEKAKNELQIASRYPEVPVVQKLIKQFDQVLLQEKIKVNNLIEFKLHQDALHVLNVLIDMSPLDIDFYLLRSKCFRLNSNFPLAVKDLMKAITLSGGSHEQAEKELSITFFEIAESCLKENNHNEALRYYRQAIKWKKNVQYYIRRGDCYHAVKKHEKALKNYKTALELSPNNETIKKRLAILYNEWGRILFDKEQLGLAEHEFTRSIEIFPFAKVYHNRAKTRFKLQNYHEGLKDLAMSYYIDKNNESKELLSRMAPQLLGDKPLVEYLENGGYISQKQERYENITRSSSQLEYNRNDTSPVLEPRSNTAVEKQLTRLPSINSKVTLKE